MSEKLSQKPGKKMGPISEKKSDAGSAKKMQEQSLQRMEALLKQSSMGIHILFDNISIANVLKHPKDDKDFFNFDRMKKVQDVMTQLVAQTSYDEKMAYVKDLDADSYELLVRTYFHIVENTIRAGSDHAH